MSDLRPLIVTQLDRSFATLTALIDASLATPPANGQVLRDLVKQLIQQFGPIILTWIITLLTPADERETA